MTRAGTSSVIAVVVGMLVGPTWVRPAGSGPRTWWSRASCVGGGVRPREELRADSLLLRGCCGEGRLDLLPAAVTLGVLARVCRLVAMVRNGGVGERLWRLPGLLAEADDALVDAVLVGT